MLLKLSSALSLHGDLIKNADSDLVSPGWGLRLGISSKLSSPADAARLQMTLTRAFKRPCPPQDNCRDKLQDSLPRGSALSSGIQFLSTSLCSALWLKSKGASLTSHVVASRACLFILIQHVEDGQAELWKVTPTGPAQVSCPPMSQ